jgi:hypothetical protein
VSKENVQWVRDTLKEYLQFGFIKRVATVPYCVMPLQVKTSPSKNSLIYDMTALNEYVDTNKFSLEGWPEMFEYCKTANFGIKFDMKKFYYEVDLNPDYYKYFGFSYVLEDGSEPELFVWTTLPFGYTRAPFIVRHLMKPLISKWRSLGAACVVFYDDGMCVDESKAKLEKLSLQIQVDLLSAGLLPGIEKCVWQPTKALDWNGLRFDLLNKGVSILPARIENLLVQGRDLLERWPNITYRDTARFVGRVVSMKPVFQGLVQIRTKMCQTFVNIRHYRNQDWDVPIHANYGPLYAEAYEEILFWLQYVKQKNFRFFNMLPVNWTIWTDASDTAIAGVAVNHGSPLITGPITLDNYFINPDTGKFVQHYYKRLQIQDVTWPGSNKRIYRDKYDLDPVHEHTLKIAHRSLTVAERRTDSNERELLAIHYSLHSLLPQLAGQVVNLHADNQNAATIIMQGSNKPRLQVYAKAVSDFCMEHDILLTASWLPRMLKYVADTYSRAYDPHSYSVTQSFYNVVVSDFKVTPNLDVFADSRTAKTERFFSLTFCPHTLGVDAFNYCWGSPNVCWLFPPPKLVLSTVQKLKSDKGIGLLLVPQWKNADFYPLLRHCLNTYPVRKIVYNGTGIFVQGDDPTSYFDKHFKGNVEVWHLNFVDV